MLQYLLLSLFYNFVITEQRKGEKSERNDREGIGGTRVSDLWPTRIPFASVT